MTRHQDFTQRLCDFRCFLAKPVDGASLALFRICFGFVLIWSMMKLIWSKGGVSALGVYYRDAVWNFPYVGFEWVRPWPEPWLTVHIWIVALAGLALMLGVFRRLAATTAFLGYTAIFLWEQSTYNNHYYLICLFAFLLIFLPSERRFSLNRLWRTSESPSNRGQVPFWTVLLIRFQLFVVYFFGGIAKLESDWISGEPLYGPADKLRTFLIEYAGMPESVLIIHVGLFLAWVGLIYDLAIGFLLCIPRTRIFGLTLTGIFHGINHFMLPIGVFPFMAFSTTLIFLPPDWPSRFFNWLRHPHWIGPDRRWFWWGGLLVPIAGFTLGWRVGRQSDPVVDGKLSPMSGGSSCPPISWLATGFFAFWVAFQVLFPLRHFFIDGNASWTEEGQYFAWRMMLRQKAAGFVTLHVDDPGVKQADQEATLDWDKYPKDMPRIVYASIDCTRFDWSSNSGLQLVFEPALGYRVLYVPRGASPSAVASELTRVGKFWETKLGEQAEFAHTVPTLSVLAKLGDRLDSLDGLTKQQQAFLRRSLDQVTAAFQVSTPSAMQTERRQAMLVDLVEYLQLSRIAAQIQSELRQLAPFGLQGAPPKSQPIYCLGSYRDAESAYQVLDRLRTSDSSLVWVDLSRLRPRAWKQLPLKFVTFDGGQLPVVWNYFRELNSRQIDNLGARPVMIQQYAKRIAHIWYQETGRRPKVHAFAYIMMNYRFPQLLVDPKVDMATADYRLLRHNPWIITHDAERIGIADQERAGTLR